MYASKTIYRAVPCCTSTDLCPTPASQGLGVHLEEHIIEQNIPNARNEAIMNVDDSKERRKNGIYDRDLEKLMRHNGV